MLTLANLSPNKGANRKRKRVGRGRGSGCGKTAGRGHKGARSRSGYGRRPGFEGGQMPLQRRLPKRGFHNKFGVEYALVSLSQLELLADEKEISVETLVSAGVVKKNRPVKVLANGEISKAVTVTVDKISKSAQSMIEKAGGTVKLLKGVLKN